ncbi:unnamed protein product [Arabis nemorensis]|uniref:Uncharacterized protein n=1 Tax=Arabis nemorensis TaxID=586526 RepID=A0A565C6P4_9BRAS|nr:unnamed protein product [Arabis nemorensis]
MIPEFLYCSLISDVTDLPLSLFPDPRYLPTVQLLPRTAAFVQSVTSLDPNGTGSRWSLWCSHDFPSLIDGGLPSHHHLRASAKHRSSSVKIGLVLTGDDIRLLRLSPHWISLQTRNRDEIYYCCLPISTVTVAGDVTQPSRRQLPQLLSTVLRDGLRAHFEQPTH